MHPRPESRITTLESRVSVLEASLQELSADQAEELRIIKQAVQRVHDTMMSSFNEIGDLFDRNWERFTAIEKRLDRIESDVSTIKTMMATKDDLRQLEARIDDKLTALKNELLNSMKQLLQQNP